MNICIAALYVETDGCYFGQNNIDPWDNVRDARKYQGPWPVIAHPDCKRWGKFAKGGPAAPNTCKVGDDEGCFEHALASVRRFGGVLEHPAYSKAWPFFNLRKPPKEGGWILADEIGWTCHLEQGHYGHFSRKPTWLYASYHPDIEMIWGVSPQRLPVYALERYGYEKARRIGVMAAVGGKNKTRIRNATPVLFRNLLVEIAMGSVT